ncbi:Hypothetical protein R9X50_00146300 [Acrodontium crateriforme]|uniref:Uncharacterized protein n=1 Tax=Acrodontium crateriforme TaxID=150365 RepID=A0AAQ3R2U5_9PEZI|nr:Hypothetical protein R9X50_00146300 [Acrodontium crateriforme]
MEESEDTFYSEGNPTDIHGIDVNCTDGGGPTVTTNLHSSEVAKWFASHPPDGDATLRILGQYMPKRTDSPDETSASYSGWQPPPLSRSIGFTEETTKHAFWNPNVYRDLAQSRAGGAAAMLDEPFRFMLQTPYDAEGPFCSMALSKHGHVVKGIFIYDDRIFEPTRILQGERIQSGWRSEGMQVISLPQAVVKAQSAWVSARLSGVTATIAGIERLLVEPLMPGHSGRDYASLSRALQACGATLIDLERRSRFETQVLDAIETVTQKSRYGQVPWPSLAPLRASIIARRYEFEVLPRRIENARMTIGNLVQQHNDLMNFETAESSRRIAEATLSESASMKAIAVMTMIFLPGTAVASFFSMAMFDWNANDGSELASKWLWIYFVIAIPLTGLVLMVWWVFSKRMAKGVMREFKRRELHRVQTDLTPYLDTIVSHHIDANGKDRDLEMQTMKVDDGKAAKAAAY